MSGRSSRGSHGNQGNKAAGTVQAAGTVHKRDHVPGKGYLKEQAGVLISRRLTLPSAPAGGVMMIFPALAPKKNRIEYIILLRHYTEYSLAATVAVIGDPFAGAFMCVCLYKLSS